MSFHMLVRVHQKVETQLAIHGHCMLSSPEICETCKDIDTCSGFGLRPLAWLSEGGISQTIAWPTPR